MLLMKKKFFEAIRGGRKNTTLRYWRVRRIRPGSVHTVPGLGKVHVESVGEVDPEGLDDGDARRDGFANAAELRAELRRLYPASVRAERKLYLLRFKLVEPRS